MNNVILVGDLRLNRMMISLLPKTVRPLLELESVAEEEELQEVEEVVVIEVEEAVGEAVVAEEAAVVDLVVEEEAA